MKYTVLKPAKMTWKPLLKGIYNYENTCTSYNCQFRSWVWLPRIGTWPMATCWVTAVSMHFLTYTGYSLNKYISPLYTWLYLYNLIINSFFSDRSPVSRLTVNWLCSCCFIDWEKHWKESICVGWYFIWKVHDLAWQSEMPTVILALFTWWY